MFRAWCGKDKIGLNYLEYYCVCSRKKKLSYRMKNIIWAIPIPVMLTACSANNSANNNEKHDGTRPNLPDEEFEGWPSSDWLEYWYRTRPGRDATRW